MVLKDFFHLNDAELRHRLSHLTDDQLLRHDIHNCRTKHSGEYGAVLSILEAPVTQGISLIGTAIAIRRWHVAKKRLRMIHDETFRRGLVVHQQTLRDYLIPFAISVACAGLSFGVAQGVELLPSGNLVEALLGETVEAGVIIGAQAVEETGEDVAMEIATERLLGGGWLDKERRKVWADRLKRSRSSISLRSGRRSSAKDLENEQAGVSLLSGLENGNSSMVTLRSKIPLSKSEDLDTGAEWPTNA